MTPSRSGMFRKWKASEQMSGYFNTDWYIDQMTRPAYESQPFPFSLTKEDYRQGGLNDFLLYDPNSGITGAINIKQ